MAKIIKKIISQNSKHKKTCKAIENKNEYTYMIYFGKNAISTDTLK